MKTVLFKLSGTPKPNDLIVLSYASPRGGRTHVMHRARGQRVFTKENDDGTQEPLIVPPDTIEDIARELVAEIDRGWMKEAFEPKHKKASADASTVVIQCTGLVENVVFSGEVEGSDGIKIDIEEI